MDSENNINGASNMDQNRLRSSIIGNIRVSGVNFQRRTAESSRLIRENLNTVMEEIRPLVEQARTVNQGGISLSSFLRQSSSENVNNEESVVINMDANGSHIENGGHDSHGRQHGHEMARNLNVTLEEAPNQTNNSDSVNDTSAVDALRQVPEARALLEVLRKYIPFVILLLFKAFYDHREGIFNFIVLILCFCHANAVVKSEAAKQNRRSLSKLILEIFYIFACILIITFMFIDENVFSNLIFIPYTKSLSVWDLLWTVGITDFYLKLVTVLVKICIVALPAKIIAYQKRGKFYLLIEATSQLYRSVAPIQPWLYYLLEPYTGFEKIAGVFLSATYMVSKGADLLSRVRFFKNAFLKALQNVRVGVSPTKEQLSTIGAGQCPICHDDFDCPVLLQCKHIFCEVCVSTWFDREQTCPLCRAKVVDDPAWRDGSTTFFIQLF